MVLYRTILEFHMKRGMEQIEPFLLRVYVNHLSLFLFLILGETSEAKLKHN